MRVQRVSRLLQREIADILAREVEEAHMITVTEARVTRDLSVVDVHVSVFGSTAEQREDTFRHLQRQTAFIRGLLGRRIRHQMRAVPTIRFRLDETPESARRMEVLFDKIRKERQSHPDQQA